jgi:hypothetical protein
MGKHSAFERKPRDFYPTPFGAVIPLMPHLPWATRFVEPCCGDGALINHIVEYGHEHQCVAASDVEPKCGMGKAIDAFDLDHCAGDMFITNPPWARHILHPLIVHLSGMAPTWLLFDADWMHTKQSANLMPFCRAIVSVGRVKWIPDSTMTGKDNAAWYLFDRRNHEITAPIFIGRAA